MDGDSGLGGLAAILPVITVIVLIAGLIGFFLALAGFFAAGVGINLLVRACIGTVAESEKPEPSTHAARLALAVIYAVPFVLLFLTAPYLWSQDAVGQLICTGGLCLSMPAYYWTWWNGVLNLRIIKPGAAVSEVRFSVPFKIDDTMHAEERILWARLRAWFILRRFDARIWFAKLVGDAVQPTDSSFKETKHEHL